MIACLSSQIPTPMHFKAIILVRRHLQPQAQLLPRSAGKKGRVGHLQRVGDAQTTNFVVGWGEAVQFPVCTLLRFDKDRPPDWLKEQLLMVAVDSK